MPRQKKRTAYLLHEPTSQARVRIEGRDHHLGSHGSHESGVRCDDLIADWLIRQDTSRETMTVDDLVPQYLQHADEHYRIKRMFRWAVAEELVKPSALVALEAVQGFQEHRFVPERGRLPSQGPDSLDRPDRAVVDTTAVDSLRRCSPQS